MRILLVEDDLTAARGVSLMLKSSGAAVDHTETGEEALELARHYEYTSSSWTSCCPTSRDMTWCGECAGPTTTPRC